MTCPAHPWNLPTGLPCLGDGEGHTHRYEASDAPDRHTDEVVES